MSSSYERKDSQLCFFLVELRGKKNLEKKQPNFYQILMIQYGQV